MSSLLWRSLFSPQNENKSSLLSPLVMVLFLKEEIKKQTDVESTERCCDLSVCRRHCLMDEPHRCPKVLVYPDLCFCLHQTLFGKSDVWLCKVSGLIVNPCGSIIAKHKADRVSQTRRTSVNELTPGILVTRWEHGPNFVSPRLHSAKVTRRHTVRQDSFFRYL